MSILWTDLEYSIIEEVAKTTISKWLTKCIAQTKKRKELQEKENKWKTLKKRFKSTEMRRSHVSFERSHFERSKTLDERRSSSVARNYLVSKTISDDDSPKDESDVETEEDGNQSDSGKTFFVGQFNH